MNDQQILYHYLLNTRVRYIIRIFLFFFFDYVRYRESVCNKVEIIWRVLISTLPIALAVRYLVEIKNDVSARAYK